jgi:hypothetical protein
MATDTPPGIYSFDIEKDPSGPLMPSTTLPGLTEANQQFDDGSTNRANQITTEVDPWTQEASAAQLSAAITQAQQPMPATDPAPQVPQPVAAPVDEQAKLKKIIGDQGNTIGELRKLVGTLVERVTAAPAAQPAPPANLNLFRGREPNDYPTAAEIQQALLAAGGELYQAINQRLEEMSVQGQLTQAGATPEELAMIRLEYPSIAALPATERQAVIAAVLKAKRAESNQSQAAFVQQATQTAQAGVRQQVYVPQPQPTSSIPQAGAVIDVDAFGNIKDSNKMAAQLRALGVQRVNDIGRRG